MNRPVDTAAPNTDGELPCQAVPVVGIDVARLDCSMRQAAAYLFPKERGFLLLTLLLEYGEVRSMDLDGSGPVEVAVIQIPSVEVFARAHQGWSKDTALRYIAVLEALQILQRHRHATCTEIHVPLIPWSPTQKALEELDNLLVEDAAREKLQQLASGVKARFLLLYGSPRAFSSLFDDLLLTLTDVSDLLNKRLSATKRQLLQLRVENLKFRLEEAHQKGDFQNLTGIPYGPDHAQKGDFHSRAGGSYIPGDAQKGDFQTGPASQNISRHAQKGDLGTGLQRANGLRPTQKGDLGADQPDEFAEKGDFQAQNGITVVQKGDFQAAGPGASLNDNVITPYNDIPGKDDVIDNDAAAAAEKPQGYPPKEASKVGQKLAMFLEKTPEHTGGFVKKCKLCAPTVIQAAVIDTLVHSAFPTIDPADDRGRPRNKASWFHDACKKYNNPGTPIPGFIKKWLKTDLYWQELEAYWNDIATQLDEAERRYKRYMTTESSEAPLVRQFLCGEIDQQTLDEALQQVDASAPRASYAPTTGSRQPESPTSATNGKPSVASTGSSAETKTWMDEYEAEALAEEIMHDEQARALGVSKAVAKQEHGVSVVMVTWNGTTFPMKSAQAWRTHFEKVQLLMTSQQQKQLRERGQ